MKILRRSLIAIVVIIVTAYWILPAGISMYMVNTASAVTKVVPANLKDSSISQSAGATLTYFGQEFDVPWGDLNTSQTQVMADKPDRQSLWLSFRSGLKLFVVMKPPRKTAFNYAMMKRINETTPDGIHYWMPFSNREVYPQLLTLQLKSNLLREIGVGAEPSPAESGIYNIDSSAYKGFQYGDPRTRPETIELSLYSDDCDITMKFLQTAYEDPVGVTQPEINRIVQSLRRVSSANPVAQR